MLLDRWCCLLAIKQLPAVAVADEAANAGDLLPLEVPQQTLPGVAKRTEETPLRKDRTADSSPKTSAEPPGSGQYSPSQYLRFSTVHERSNQGKLGLQVDAQGSSLMSRVNQANHVVDENRTTEKDQAGSLLSNPFRREARPKIGTTADQPQSELQLSSADGTALPMIQFAEHRSDKDQTPFPSLPLEPEESGGERQGRAGELLAAVPGLAQLNAVKRSQAATEQQKSQRASWGPKPVSMIGVDIAPPSGKMPQQEIDIAAGHQVVPQSTSLRPWARLSYQFAATCSVHNPLYFEEVNLERYGYRCGYCLQPLASAAHFFTRVPMLPYMMANDCPNECEYTLGHYRPGDCVPWRHECIGWGHRGGLAQTGAVLGLVFLIP